MFGYLLEVPVREEVFPVPGSLLGQNAHDEDGTKTLPALLKGLAIAFVSLMVMAGDCGDVPSKPLSSDKDIEILFHNADPLAVHMFLGDGQTFPCCQVPSQGTRVEHVMMAIGNSVHLHAGRNGELLVFRKVCTLGQQGYDAGSVSVVYFDGALSCMGW